VSQVIGKDFRTRIPVFGDDASIQEAFYVYHYGVNNYTSQPIPDDSIEGHFRLINERVSANESAIAGLGQTFVEEVSQAASPNIISPQNNTVVPLTIRGVQNQIANLQRWLNSDNNVMAAIFENGAVSFNSYVNIGNVTQSTSIGVNISLAGATHRGIIVKGFTNQTGNLQEWQNSAGTALARVDNIGRLYSETFPVVTLSQTQTLTNKTLQSPTINNPTISSATVNTATINNATINGAVLNNALSLTLSLEQNPFAFRARNIRASTAGPSGGVSGDVWIRYQ
jgi:hypothetical protein